jgi:hypothetical protein
MPIERILITVKTYPTLSAKYGELVCTAGLRENGTWIRIYPVPFRQLEAYQKFQKYSFIEAEVIRNTRDARPESHKVSTDTLNLTGEFLSTQDHWRERRQWILNRGTVHTNLANLIEANKQGILSIATFKPSKIIDFKAEPDKPDWGDEKLAAVDALAKQGDLFSGWKGTDLAALIRKLPWKFSYTIEDDVGKRSTMMIEDWEIGELYWNCLRTSNSPSEAVEKVRQKYLAEFATKDLYLYLGTTKKYDRWASNPFVIIGVFYPPFKLQTEFDLFNNP